MDEALQASEARFHALVENSSDIMTLFDAQGTVLYESPSTERLLGYSPEDRIGRNVFNDPIVHPDDLAAKRAFFEAARHGHGTPVTAEFRLRHADGSWRDIEAVGQSFRQGPDVAGVVANYRDVTERKKADEALRRQAQLLHLSYDAILVWRIDGSIEQWNRGAEQLYGFSESEALGRVTHELLRTVHPVPWPEVEAAMRKHGQWEGELRHFAKDGHEVVVSARHQLVVGSDGIERILETNRDITDRKKADEALAAAKTAAEAATEAKSRFIAALSHELRTPLTPVVAALDLLLDDEALNRAAREHLEMIQRNVALEIRLIDDLLDVTRITKGKLKLVSQPVDVLAVLRESVRICSGESSAKGQTVTVEAPEATCMVMGDSARLHQVFWNLVTNAVKFTPEGGTIALKCRVKEADPPTLVVEVSDTGRGIQRKDLARIFAPFEQPDGETGSFEGLGLGLSICKAVVELHGGRIGVSSQGRGEGTTFTVELPVADVERGREPGVRPAAVPSRRKARRKLRILLVEDNADTADVMAIGIGYKGGHEVKTAGSVRDALAAMDDQTFDLLLCDVRLPDGTGYDLMAKLVAAGSPTRGIVISGFGTLEDKQRSREAGFAEHLVKPVTFGKLLETLERVAAAS